MLDYELFDELGEEAVRGRISSGRFGGNRLGFANEWLGRLDLAREASASIERELRMEASNAESLRIARSAKNAAWAAAIAAAISIIVAVAMPFFLN